MHLLRQSADRNVPAGVTVDAPIRDDMDVAAVRILSLAGIPATGQQPS